MPCRTKTVGSRETTPVIDRTLTSSHGKSIEGHHALRCTALAASSAAISSPMWILLRGCEAAISTSGKHCSFSVFVSPRSAKIPSTKSTMNSALAHLLHNTGRTTRATSTLSIGFFQVLIMRYTTIHTRSDLFNRKMRGRRSRETLLK